MIDVQFFDDITLQVVEAKRAILFRHRLHAITTKKLQLNFALGNPVGIDNLPGENIPACDLLMKFSRFAPLQFDRF